MKDVADVLPHTVSWYKLALTVGCSSASCERSFSVMKMIKSYLRSSMSEYRMLGLSLLYIERNIAIDKEGVISKFAAGDRNRCILLA